MKKWTLSLVALLAFAASASSFATIIDTVNKGLYMTAGQSTITNHFVAGGPFESAELTINLADDRCDSIIVCQDWFGESAFTIGLGHAALIDGGVSTMFELGGLGLAQLNLLGSYTYSLTATSGDFWFVSSVLALETAVPEPGSLLLLGAGLLGLVGMRRRLAA